MVCLKDYLKEDHVLFLEKGDKKSILNQMIDNLSSSSSITDKGAFSTAVFDRETIISTGIGLGIAIPHVKIPSVRDITIGIGICPEGVEWDALDNQPVHIIFLIAANTDQHQIYLRLLSKIVLVLKKKERQEKLVEAKDPSIVLKQFSNL